MIEGRRGWARYGVGPGGQRSGIQRGSREGLVGRQPSDEVRVVLPGTRRAVPISGLDRSQLISVRRDVAHGLREIDRGRYFTDEIDRIFTILGEMGMRQEDIAERLGIEDRSKLSKKRNGEIRTTLAELNALLELIPSDRLPLDQRTELVQAYTPKIKEFDRKAASDTRTGRDAGTAARRSAQRRG